MGAGGALSRMSERRPTVLVADDEPGIVDEHAARLESEYAVRRAYSGREALDRVDGFLDVALLARRMSDIDGDEVLERVRGHGYDCQVAMLAGVEPGVDVAAMGFDDCLLEPVPETELLSTVDRLHRRKTYDEGLRRLFSLASRAAALEAEHDLETLRARPEYRHLRGRLEALRDELDRCIADLPQEDRLTVAVDGTGRASP